MLTYVWYCRDTSHLPGTVVMSEADSVVELSADSAVYITSQLQIYKRFTGTVGVH